jgi:sortase A
VSRVARIASVALITAGLVVLLDAGITLAWSEPISTVRGWLAQRDLAEDLDALEQRYAGQPATTPDGKIDREQVRGQATDLAARAREGEAIGRLKIAPIDLNIVMVQGTETGSLQKGPGHYPGTALPGQPGTVAIAGHRTTYLAPFRHIDEIGRGDEVVVEMPYATFRYRFERQRIVDPSEVGVVRDVGHDRLVLTACHPLYSAAQRIVVFARLVDIDPPGGDDDPGGGSSTSPEIGEAGLGPTLVGVGGLIAIALVISAAPVRRPDRSDARRERAIGVLAGLVVGLAIVFLFVFVFSGETVDAPSLSGEASRLPAKGS